ncbi:MAG: ABC transporter substrate-binding protein, partial [Nitrososphaerales archaeon]|nr:ABC transporter substrate-binding protein [Nitrososphaerales archaeon]
IIAVSVVAYYYMTIPPERTIRIGLVASLTGAGSAEGTDMERAAMLAVEEINAAGGVYVSEYGKNLKISLIVRDDRTTPADGVTAVTELITLENIDVLVGGFSSGVTIASQVPAIENNVPFVITGASSSYVTRRTDKNTSYMFHYCTITDDYSETIVRFLNYTVRPTLIDEGLMDPGRNLRLAMLIRNDPYGQGCRQSTETFISDLGLPIDIVEVQTFEPADTTFVTQLSVIGAANPDAVYHAGFTMDTSTAIKQGLQLVDLKTIYIGVECCEQPQFYELLGSWGDHQILESKFGPQTPPYYEEVTNYNATYYERWTMIPGMMGADTYDAIYLVCEAIENAGTLDKAGIRDEIENIEMNQMLIMMKDGIISFDENHEIDPLCFIEQMIWNGTTSELTPYIVYPDSLKQRDFELPPDYENLYS